MRPKYSAWLLVILFSDRQMDPTCTGEHVQKGQALRRSGLAQAVSDPGRENMFIACCGKTDS